MPENAPGKLPDDTYEASDIEKTIEALPIEMQTLIREGIVKAKFERKAGGEAMQLKSYIAEFAIALHINSSVDSDSYPDHVNTINWSRLTWDLSETVIRYQAKNLRVEIPESLRKAIAYTYAGNEFVRGAERDEVDELLIGFGYPTQQIFDDLLDEIMTEGRNGEYTRDQVKEKMSEYFENIELWDHISRLEPVMRQDLISLGYQLPDLEPDNSYGYSEEEGENFPQVTRAMLPS